MNLIFRMRMVCLTQALTACAGQPRENDSGEIRLIGTDELQGCRNVGSAHVSVMDKLDELQGDDLGVETALLKLARQSAAQLGGNAIIEMTPVLDGRRSYAVFLCR